MQNSLEIRTRQSASKLVLLPLHLGEVGLNGCCAWRHGGKASSDVAQKRERLSQQMPNVVKLSAISAVVEADFQGLLFLIRRHQILMLGLDLYRSFAVGRQKALSLLSHLQ
jgi:hypothetical protein